MSSNVLKSVSPRKERQVWLVLSIGMGLAVTVKSFRDGDMGVTLVAALEDGSGRCSGFSLGYMTASSLHYRRTGGDKYGNLLG